MQSLVVRGSESYDSLVEECKDILIEKNFDMNWTRIEMYHGVGSAIRRTVKKDESITKLLRQIAEDMNVVERTLWYAVQFYDKYPDLKALPDGKAATWSKVKQDLPVNKRLDAPQLTDPGEIAKGIIRKYGVETSVQIAESLSEIIKEHNEEFNS